ncbi:MAG: hypothetical protein P8N76_12800 [Pirellulaceae bacterium]|nr:hypothetical protein [Pirellulaceae bacterium]
MDSLGDALTYFLTPSGQILIDAIPNLDGQLGRGKRLANIVWYHNCVEGEELDKLMNDRSGVRRPISLPPGSVTKDNIDWFRNYAREQIPSQFVEVLEKVEQRFVQVIYHIKISRMAFERTCLMGDAAFAARPHAAAGTAKTYADGRALRDALRDTDGDVQEALRIWEPGNNCLRARERWAIGLNLNIVGFLETPLYDSVYTAWESEENRSAIYPVHPKIWKAWGL